MSFNHYLHEYIIYGDGEGSITVWNANRAKAIRSFQEHRNVSSVMFNPVEPGLFVSGSEDGIGTLFESCITVIQVVYYMSMFTL